MAKTWQRINSGNADSPYTIDDLISVCIARQLTDGEIVAQGIATPLVTAGYILAKCTHAPNLRFASAIGQGVSEKWAPLGLARIEEHWLGHTMMTLGFVTVAADVLPQIHPTEFFRPAQVDSAGNFNNVAVGKDYAHPRLRLPGTGGIPDVTVYSDKILLYVPRHSRVTFVPKLDFVSGMGHTAARKRGAGVGYLLSDLGQFDWVDGTMRLTSIHPGVDIQQIHSRTGFELAIAPDVHETPPPTAEELRLLYEVIDPLGVRRLETLGGSARRDLIRYILEKEDVL